MILSFLVIIMYACVEGFTHAVLYGRRGADSFKWNEHLLFNAQRAILVTALFFKPDIYSIISGLLCFSFFHNGFYYTQRDRIDNSYPKRWWDDSTSSSATINFSVKVRTGMAIAGILVMIFALTT